MAAESQKILNLVGLIICFACLVIIELVHQLLYPSLSVTTVILLQLLLIIFCAYRWGTRLSLIIVAVSFLQTDYFYIPKLFSFSIDSLENFLMLIVFVATAVIIGQLVQHIKKQVEKERFQENFTRALYEFTHVIAVADDIQKIYKHTVQTIFSTFHYPAFLLVPQNRILIPAAHFPETDIINHMAWGAARWAWENKKPCGNDTDTLPRLGFYIKPLQAGEDYFGLLVLALKKKNAKVFSTQSQKKLFESLCTQAAQAIYRTRLEEQKKEAEIFKRADELQRTLLASISHDLRTPLVSIMGSISSILEYKEKFDERTERDLLQTALEESQRLNRYISNLIAMTQLESDVLKLNRKWTDIYDIIRNATAIIHRTNPNRTIEIHEADTLPLVFIDPIMTEQVFVNLLENAIKYSKPDSRIQIISNITHAGLEVNIIDQGIGIAAEDLPHIFERFYRAKKGALANSGYGLGLTICKSILENEEATITASSAGSETGSIFTIIFKKLKEITEWPDEKSES